MSEKIKKPKSKPKAKPAPAAKWEGPKTRPLPVLKYTRRKQVGVRRNGKPKYVAEAFLLPSPKMGERGVRAGPGMGFVPKDGQWYEVSFFLLRRIRDGALIEGKPTREEMSDVTPPAKGKE